MKEIFIVIVSIILLTLLVFFMQGFDYASLVFWGPKYENAHREIFENTKSFRDGSSRDLDNLRVAYVQAKTPEEKAVILDTLRHRSLGIPSEQISPAINQLINQGQ